MLDIIWTLLVYFTGVIFGCWVGYRRGCKQGFEDAMRSIPETSPFNWSEYYRQNRNG